MNIGSAIQDLSRLTQQIQALAQQLQGMKKPAAPPQAQGAQAKPSMQQPPFQQDTFEGGATQAPQRQPSYNGHGGVNNALGDPDGNGKNGQGGVNNKRPRGRAGSTDTAQQAATPSMTPTGQQFTAKGTGYFPDNSPMEGGFKDRMGKPLHTLQDFLAGKAPYVSVAMDSKAFPYGTKLRIPELEKKYGRPIEFRVVDTGGAFKGKGTSRIDICTANQKASLDPTINGKLTLIPQK
ncbi:MAG TPA: hypothetical protein VFA20_02745 [Myxococcaceae bacterium]|nr:hypothetical protein [Myxococcaceae bacterium]